MRRSNLLMIFIIALLFLTNPSFAHCDGVDGPVVISAKKAIATKNIEYVLIWVQEQYESEIKSAFEKTLTVREESTEAQELADMYFFETLVRLHRLGEGAPYTGLKPAGRDLGPAIPLADASIESESPKELYKLLTDTVHNGLHQYFENVLNNKDYELNDVKSGREFVKSYVEFVHYVEGIYNAAESSTEHHGGKEIESHKH